MRNPPRPPGPPSTLSASSGHGLVYGTHRPRGPQLAFTTESVEPAPTKRKTKLIVILGITLPVLACIIGIAAWAVTTDVLRITPRANDNNFNRFGHQGKTRIDSMQSRSDQDVDVFVLHGITPPTTPSPNSSTKKSPSTTMSTTGSSVSTRQTMTSPKAADILSKLLSDMPPPKNPKNFVVFAPIADTETTQSHRKGRRLDTKLVHDGDDLVAEESVMSEDTSQELGADKAPFSRKLTLSDYSLKPGLGPAVHKTMNHNGKMNRNPGLLQVDQTSEGPPTYIKRPQRGDFVTFPTNTKQSSNSIASRKGGVTRPNVNFPRNNFPNPQQNNVNGFQKNAALDHQPFRSPPQSFDNMQPNAPIQNYQTPSFQQSATFHKNDNQQQFQPINVPNTQNRDFLQPNSYQSDNQRPTSFQNQQSIGSTQNQFSPAQGNPPPNYSNPPQSTFSVENSPANSGGPQYFAPPPQTFHTKINYDQPSKFSPSSSLSSFEKVAQSSIDPSAGDGTHHHHHHHHHHEPVPSNSDPVGDVNFSDVPRTNDADRLGSIGIGLGPSRGITVQIGGGGGGGLGGLLPLGTLGIARNIISALLPRPQLGLNSKVFLGVEVGKGGGFALG